MNRITELNKTSKACQAMLWSLIFMVRLRSHINDILSVPNITLSSAWIAILDYSITRIRRSVPAKDYGLLMAFQLAQDPPLAHKATTV